MAREIISFAILFVSALLVQVLICNHIVLFNVAAPVVFIYFIIRLPIHLPVNWVLTLSFLLGWMVDIFSDTMGMNTLACTLTAMMRRKIFSLYNSREEKYAEVTPCVASLGLVAYMKYMFTFVLIYCLLIYFIEYFSFSNINIMLIKICSSALLTFVLLLGIDSLVAKRT